tara:strand:+ start:89 stop:904 length:816 start_codon:yes stop_codon:yes gene_type:complete
MKVKNLLDDSKTPEPPMTLPIEVFSPWANLIIKFKIPDVVFQELENLYDYTMKNYKSFGYQLVGQIEHEPEVTQEILEKYPRWASFCLESVRNFVMTQHSVTMAAEPEKLEKIRNEKFLSKINTMWFVNQKPHEYNPIHIHTNCKISSVCYLKTPKQQIKGRKDHYQSDGKITFTNNTGTDGGFSNAQCSFEPKAGDMYVFGALQHHAVWPYRSADPDDLRVSLSFNADVTTQEDVDRQNKNMEKAFEDMKKMKESENDKGLTDGDLNKFG